MFKGRTYLERYQLPEDETAPLLIENLLKSVYDRAVGPVVERWYQFSLQQAWDGMEGVVERGIPLYGVYDHLQWMGPTCQKMAKPWIEKHPEPFQSQHIVIGTSEVGNNIVHAKEVSVNCEIDGYAVPDGDFDSLDAAFAAGYPVTWISTYNPSSRSMQQVNEVFLIPGKIVAADTARSILSQRDWIIKHQQRYQPYPVAGG